MNVPAPLDTRAFEDELREQGCANIGVVEWSPGRISARHAHDFTAVGLVLEGAFTLETPDGARLLEAGARFEVAAGTPHVETIGAAGVRILSGRL